MGFAQTRNFSSEKDNVKRMKDKPETGTKKLQNTLWRKDSSKIYKELLKFNNKKTNKAVKK